MRRRLSTISIALLVMAIVVSGVAGCSRSAKEREAPTTEQPATEEAEAPGTKAVTPGPGQTVVSVVTPVAGVSTPATGEQPATEATTTVPAVSEAAPTPVPTTAPAPLPTQAPAASTSGEAVVHTVGRGETVSSIAEHYGTTTQAIAQANNLKDPSKIYTGQKLKIPTEGGSTGQSTGGSSSGSTSGCRIRHTVKRGEWVWQLARDYQVSPYAILKANGLTIKQGSNVHPGQVLCIP